MSEEWVPADSVAKNQAGEYQALIGGQWVPATAAAKSDTGEYRVIRAAPPAPMEAQNNPIDPRRALQSLPRALAFGTQFKSAPPNDMGFDTASYKIGGHVTDLAAPYMPPQLAALLGATARMGPDIAMNAAAGLIGAVKGAPLVEDAAKNVMKIAVNPTPADLVSGKAGKAINFMLKNDISPTASNMLSLRNQITNLDSQVADVIKNSPETIKTGGIFESLKPAMDRFIRSGDPKDIATLRKAWTDFVNHPMIQGAEEIPIQTAQSIKTAKSSLLNSRLYGEMGSADTAAEKGLIHGLKTGIAAKAPEVVPLNELSSELRNVIDVSERKALMKLAHNPVDMAFVFSTPEHYAAYSLGRSKAFLGGMARILYHNKEILPAGAGSAAEALYADLKRRNDKSSDTTNP